MTIAQRQSRSRGILSAAGLALLLALCGCANGSSGNSGGAQPAAPALGTIGGVAAGGVLGSTIGRGKGRTAAIVGGALLGGVLGNQVVDRPVEERKAAEREAARDREMQRRLDYERQSAIQEEDLRREFRERELYEQWKSQRVGGTPLSSAADIERAQRLLTALGHYRGPVDGIEGRETRAATQAFQRTQGLPENGVITSSLVDLMRASI